MWLFTPVATTHTLRHEPRQICGHYVTHSLILALTQLFCCSKSMFCWRLDSEAWLRKELNGKDDNNGKIHNGDWEVLEVYGRQGISGVEGEL